MQAMYYSSRKTRAAAEIAPNAADVISKERLHFTAEPSFI
jgi:hypothetical protein